MRKLMTSVIITGGIAFATPALAATTVLTFDGFACTGTDGGAVNQNCTANNQFLGVNYGSTAQVAVSYNAADVSPTGGQSQTSLYYLATGVGGRTGRGTGAETFSRIFLTPAAGYEVSLTSFRYLTGTATFLTFEANLLDSGNATVFSFLSPNSPGAGGVVFSPSTAYFSGPLTFRFATTLNGSGYPLIDDFTFDVRPIANNGAVPEPSTWAMMLFGFGLVGSTLRRRSATGVSASV